MTEITVRRPLRNGATALQGAKADTALQPGDLATETRDFLDRDALVAWEADAALSTGMTARASGAMYRYAGTGTAITDLPGWVPEGDATPAHFGAVMDGAADDTAAVQAAVNYNGRLVIPEGRTIKVVSPVVIPAGLTEFRITGKGTIKWAGDTSAQNLWDFRTNYLTVQLAKCTLSDFSITGSHATLNTYIDSYPLFVDCVDDVLIDNVEVSYSRVVGILVWRAKRVTIRNCRVHHVARGGIGAARCEQVRIIDNDVHHHGDDAIFVPNWPYTSVRGLVITGNHIDYGNGIRCLAAQVANISNNVIQHYTSFGVSVTSDAYDATNTAGLAATIAITITSNVIMDAVDRDFLDAFGGTTGTRAITFRANAATDGSLTYVPGLNGTSPYAYYANADAIAENSATTPIPVHGSVVIANNVMMRTLPRVGTYTSLGLDEFWLPDGEYDYDTASAADTEFINLGGYLDNVLVDGNICQGENVFLSIYPTTMVRNVRVTNNIVSDIRDYCVSVNATGTPTLDIVFDGNTFDMDPYHAHANRGTTGGWLADDLPRIFLRDGALGTTWIDNDFKNFCGFNSATLAALVNADLVTFDRNRLWGAPAAAGFSTSNKGVGVIPSITGQSLVHIECDPASADFGKIYRAGPTRNTSIPTSGTFTYGEYVEKTGVAVAGSAASKYVIRGWIRLTAGSAHVADTDWAECRTLTGT